MAQLTARDGQGASIVADAGPPPTVQVHGEIDVAVAEWFSSELSCQLAGLTPPVRLDLRGVTFLDSSGLAVLVALGRTTPLQIGAASDVARQVIELSGLAELLCLEP